MPNSKETLIQELDALANAINTKANSTGEKSISGLTNTVNAIATEKPEQTKTIGLSMAQGAQVIQPDEGKVLTQVTVEKPDTLIAGNIKQGVTIGAVAGNFTADANAAAEDILFNKTAYVNGQKVIGAIATKTSSDVIVSGPTVAVPSGYYSSTVTQTVATTLHPIPSMSVSSDGLITANHIQTAGYVTGGVTTATLQLTTKSAQTYTPTTSDQTIASERYLTGTQTIKGDANLIAANIAKDITIFGITGTHEGSGSSDLDELMQESF